jgi:hypothetical protein
MKTISRFALGAVVAAGVASASMAAVITANSATFSAADVGTSFGVSYDGFTGAGTIAGLTAGTLFTLTGVTGTSYMFDYAVNNTSSAPVTESRVSNFGFNTDPSIASATGTGEFSTVATNANVPNIGTVDVCFKGGGGTKSCAGGGGGGTTIGGSDAGSLTLNFAQALDSLTLSDFYVRYQSIAGLGCHCLPSSAVGSGTVSSSGGSSGGTPTPVPAPPMVLLFGAAAAALVMSRRRNTVPA